MFRHPSQITLENRQPNVMPCAALSGPVDCFIIPSPYGVLLSGTSVGKEFMRHAAVGNPRNSGVSWF